MLNLNRAAALALAATAFTTSQARSDSDGYFCVGEGYIAYEMAYSIPTDGHQLSILTPASDKIAAQRDISLPKFQVHGMVCEEDAIILRDFSGIFIVDLDTEVVTRGKAKAGPALAAQPGNLVHGRWGNLAKEMNSQIIPLPGWPENSIYELHIVNYQVRPNKHLILHYTISQLIRINESTFAEGQLIYSGNQQETID